ncbi:hypothetical protein AGMMS49975_26620 [Clostridia bacterium]|nr:hypothetical protein AGMMS49975_26620 [Clostridia bacterium]
MRDPYLYSDVCVLENRLGIKDAKILEQAEVDITSMLLLGFDKTDSVCTFDFSGLLAVHRYIFGDIYEWAGIV